MAEDIDKPVMDELHECIRKDLDNMILNGVHSIPCDCCGAKMNPHPYNPCKFVCYGCGRRMKRVPGIFEMWAVQPMTEDSDTFQKLQALDEDLHNGQRSFSHTRADDNSSWNKKYTEAHDKLMEVSAELYSVLGDSNTVILSLLTEVISQLNAIRAGFPPISRQVFWQRHLVEYVEYRTGSREIAEAFLDYINRAEDRKEGFESFLGGSLDRLSEESGKCYHMEIIPVRSCVNCDLRYKDAEQYLGGCPYDCPGDRVNCDEWRPGDGHNVEVVKE